MTKERKCLTCNKDISDLHGQQERCPDPCAKDHRRERYRLYMAKYNLKKKAERIAMRTQDDNDVLSNNHMVGLGTFIMTKKRHEDPEKEYRDIQRLKKQAGLK